VLGNPAPSRRRWNKLTGKQMMVVTWPHDLPRREPTLEAERILMVDFTATQAQAKGAAPSANREGGQTEAVVAKTPSALPPPTTNGVDRDVPPTGRDPRHRCYVTSKVSPLAQV
jgi:hypothetical protein